LRFPTKEAKDVASEGGRGLPKALQEEKKTVVKRTKGQSAKVSGGEEDLESHEKRTKILQNGHTTGKLWRSRGNRNKTTLASVVTLFLSSWKGSQQTGDEGTNGKRRVALAEHML